MTSYWIPVRVNQDKTWLVTKIWLQLLDKLYRAYFGEHTSINECIRYATHKELVMQLYIYLHSHWHSTNTLGNVWSLSSIFQKNIIFSTGEWINNWLAVQWDSITVLFACMMLWFAWYTTVWMWVWWACLSWTTYKSQHSITFKWPALCFSLSVQ